MLVIPSLNLFLVAAFSFVIVTSEHVQGAKITGF